MKKILYFIFGLIVFGWLISTCEDDETTSNEQTTVLNAEEAIDEAERTLEQVTNWHSRESTDEMSGKTRFFNSTFSTNKLYFDFPYNGGSSFTLTVRNMNGRNEVLLSTEKGQFMSSYSHNVRLKFDENSPITVGYEEPSDASSGLIFLEASSKIIANLKKGKKLKIEAPFYQEGSQIIEFDIDGFEWSH